MAAKEPRKKSTQQEMKVVLVGAVAVGKTSIASRFINNQFHENLQTTIGASYMAKDVVLDGQRLKYSVWDTAGQEVYHALVPMYFRDAAAVILVYDITKKKSFAEAQDWLTEVKQNAPASAMVALVGNKCDLPDRAVPREQAEQFAQSIGAEYMDTSAKTAQGVFELFDLLGKKFLESKEGGGAGMASSVKLRDQPGNNGKDGAGGGGAGGGGGSKGCKCG
eukprot:TRINITY_DN1644_c0_g1_i2.p3 TRINITY_DN1644_c0_g1~~TRINITY_DN1644_c0_g1_i2.p3  ORF type:complete len:221 (-),score=64.50 TRINITY_DN1644_c0_g1_i2:328-990(-)